MAAVRHREDVISQQARLLEEANRKLDQRLISGSNRTETGKDAAQKPVMVEREPDFHQGPML
jgi:hypothetical protein